MKQRKGAVTQFKKKCTSKLKLCNRVPQSLTSLILLAITTTPATASTVLMFCVWEREREKKLMLYSCQGDSDSSNSADKWWCLLERLIIVVKYWRVPANKRYQHKDETWLQNDRATLCCHVALSTFTPAGQTKDGLTRTNVKLSSANCDITDTKFPWSLRGLSLVSFSLSVPLKDSGMLLTFTPCIRRSASVGGSSMGICCAKSPPRGSVWLWQDGAEERLK